MNYVHLDSLPLNASACVSKKGDILLYDHCRVLNFSKCDLIYHSCSSFVNWPSKAIGSFIVFFPVSTGFSLELSIAISCHVSLASFNQEQTHSLSLFFTTLTFWKNMGPPMSFKFYFILILERRKGREKERERNISAREKRWSVAFCRCPDLGPTSNPAMYPNRELNWQPLVLWRNAQPTEPPWPGPAPMPFKTLLFPHD